MKSNSKKFSERNDRNLLTNSTNCGTINTKTGEGKLHKPERDLL